MCATIVVVIPDTFSCKKLILSSDSVEVASNFHVATNSAIADICSFLFIMQTILKFAAKIEQRCAEIPHTYKENRTDIDKRVVFVI